MEKKTYDESSSRCKTKIACMITNCTKIVQRERERWTTGTTIINVITKTCGTGNENQADEHFRKVLKYQFWEKGNSQ